MVARSLICILERPAFWFVGIALELQPNSDITAESIRTYETSTVCCQGGNTAWSPRGPWATVRAAAVGRWADGARNSTAASASECTIALSYESERLCGA